MKVLLEEKYVGNLYWKFQKEILNIKIYGQICENKILATENKLFFFQVNY